MEQAGITYTATIQGVLSKLGSVGQIHAADVVKKILDHHHEYASGTAREIASATWPDFDQEETKTADEWMEQVKGMFDTLLVLKLHGRLAILGLCRLGAGASRSCFTRSSSACRSGVVMGSERVNKPVNHD